MRSAHERSSADPECLRISLDTKAKVKIGDFYFYKRSNYTAAKVFYNEAITSYPESPIAARAKLRLVDVESKASGKKVAPEGKAEGDAPKKKRFWLF